MSIAIFMGARSGERDYQIYGTTIITLKMNDDQDEITFYDSIGNQLDGDFCFRDEFENGRRYLLRRMYAPIVLKKSGLGRAALEFFRDSTGAVIYVRPNDGEIREDESHLTEDAPNFVAKMMEEGLIEKYAGEDPQEHDIVYDEIEPLDGPNKNADLGSFDDLFNNGFLK